MPNSETANTFGLFTVELANPEKSKDYFSVIYIEIVLHVLCGLLTPGRSTLGPVNVDS